MTENSCKRCQHSWSSLAAEPRVCPKCKSAYWNREKKLYYDWHAKHPKASKNRLGIFPKENRKSLLEV